MENYNNNMSKYSCTRSRALALPGGIQRNGNEVIQEQPPSPPFSPSHRPFSLSLTYHHLPSYISLNIYNYRGASTTPSLSLALPPGPHQAPPSSSAPPLPCSSPFANRQILSPFPSLPVRSARPYPCTISSLESASRNDPRSSTSSTGGAIPGLGKAAGETRTQTGFWSEGYSWLPEQKGEPLGWSDSSCDGWYCT